MNITDVRDSLIVGVADVDKWFKEWQANFFEPELKAAARQMIANIPPEVLDQFAFEQPEAWEELQGQLEV